MLYNSCNRRNELEIITSKIDFQKVIYPTLKLSCHNDKTIRWNNQTGQKPFALELIIKVKDDDDMHENGKSHRKYILLQSYWTKLSTSVLLKENVYSLGSYCNFVGFLESAANAAAIVQAIILVIGILNEANSGRSCVLQIVNRTDNITLNKVVYDWITW